MSVNSYGWTQLYEEDGIKIFDGQKENSKVLTFMAKGVINVAMPELLAILRDVEDATKWDKNLNKKRMEKFCVIFFSKINHIIHS